MFAVFRKYSMKLGNYETDVDFRQYWSKQEIEEHVPKSIYLLIPFVMKKNFLIAGRSQLVYLFIGRMIEHIAVIIEAYHRNQVHIKFYRHFLCRLPLFVETSIGYHYCGFGLNRWIIYHLLRCPQILVKMGIQCSST